MKNLFISYDSNIEQAMVKLNSSGEKCLIVIDKRQRYLGTLTDGDIRRALLKKYKFLDKISYIYNKKSFFVFEKNFSLKNITDAILKYNYYLVPVLAKNLLVKNIIFAKNLIKKNHNQLLNTQIVLMAGGYGTRLEPYTNFLPKPLIPLNKKPIIEHIIDNFFSKGARNFFVSVGYKKNLIIEYFKHRRDLNIKFINEKKPLGTVGSLGLINKKFLNDNFIVTNSDIYANIDINLVMDFHILKKQDITLVVSLKEISIPYGVCQIDKEGKLRQIIEKPKFENFINIGLYVFNKKILGLIKKNQPLNFDQLIKKSLKKKYKIGVYPINNENWHDIGNWNFYENTLKIFK